jgi:hypothetical protein
MLQTLPDSYTSLDDSQVSLSEGFYACSFSLSGVGGENIRYSLPKLNKLNLCKQLLILILNYTNAT